MAVYTISDILHIIRSCHSNGMNSEGPKERPRPKCSISRVDYSKLADIKVPFVRRRKETAAEPEDVEKLYRL